ncbi:TolC family protein [Shewanella sp. WXL01]|uniref:TolC family protein n=1 Tax=Shewanella sp. WXL01 TaxID=2709721 RepID=UPI0014385DA9|nr:TolC family protein [Shewanella sp. WXL01]NKF51597.1 TolC family protein [Shewanella sp. WXL01]
MSYELSVPKVLRSLGRVSLLLGVCSFSANAHASANNEVEVLSLATAIERTMQQHPSLQVYSLRQSVLDADSYTAALSPGYEIGFEVENVAGTGEFSGIDGAEFSVSLSSVIEMGDKVAARGAVVNEKRALLAAEQKIAALAVLGELTRRYIDVMAAQAQLELADESVALANKTLETVSKRAAAGVMRDADINRAQAAVYRAQLTQQNQQQQHNYSLIALAMLWGDSHAEFQKVEGNLLQFSDDVAFNTLFEKVKYSPAIMAFASQSQLREAELRYAKTRSSADINWSVGVKQHQSSDDVALSAGFSIPLFNGDRNQGAVDAAVAAKAEVSLNRDIALLALRNELYRAYSSRKLAIAQVQQLQQQIIPTLAAAMADSELAYEQGNYSYLAYLSASEELLFAKRAMLDAATSALRFGVDIEQLIAEPLPATQHASSSFSQGSAQ